MKISSSLENLKLMVSVPIVQKDLLLIGRVGVLQGRVGHLIENLLAFFTQQIMGK